VTFASSAERHVDTVSDESVTPRHKCDILERALPAVNYSGGATFTLGAMREAQVRSRVLIKFYMFVMKEYINRKSYCKMMLTHCILLSKSCR
jgi:hypothetical protein